MSTVVTGLDQPTTFAVIGDDDFLALERTTGRVRRVTNGMISTTIARDLDVSACSSADGDGMDDERGLLGIAVHPSFSENRFVYLFYTETTGPGDHCDDPNSPVSTSNRIERYTWNAMTGTLDSPQLIRTLPSFVYYHNGGILEFGPDGMIYPVTVDHSQLMGGLPDDDPSDDVCPRPASGDDKGCGGKDANGDIGGPIRTDVVNKDAPLLESTGAEMTAILQSYWLDASFGDGSGENP